MSQTPKTVIITLEEPIQRGEQKIDKLTLRRPQAGELRGVRLAELTNGDVGAVLAVLPRISSPTLTPTEAAELDPVDLAAATSEIIGFFMTKQLRQEVEARKSSY